MNVQLRQAGTWQHSESSLDPRERLDQLRRDVRQAKAELRDVLERLAARYGITQKDVSYALDGYADDMLADLVWGVERDLEQQCDEAQA